MYTSGKVTNVIFSDVQDYNFGMNLLARCAADYPDLKIVAFELMSNHIHIVLAGDREVAEAFFTSFRRRLSRYLSGKGQELPLTFKAELKNIPDVRTLRNVIVYVNRNGYVIDYEVTPFSYKWGTGRYYFNDFPIDRRVKDLAKVELRNLTHSRDAEIPKDYLVIDNHIAPPSYCKLKFGMSMFREAHQYFSMLSRSIESYSQIATELDDGEFLTDPELFSELIKILKSDYAGAQMRDLSKAQKFDLARTLRFRFKSSQGQIVRILGISQYDVSQLFG